MAWVVVLPWKKQKQNEKIRIGETFFSSLSTIEATTDSAKNLGRERTSPYGKTWCRCSVKDSSSSFKTKEQTKWCYDLVEIWDDEKENEQTPPYLNREKKKKEFDFPCCFSAHAPR